MTPLNKKTKLSQTLQQKPSNNFKNTKIILFCFCFSAILLYDPIFNGKQCGG
jgi:hypothetical protein